MFEMESPYQVRVLGRSLASRGHPSGSRDGDWSLKLVESGRGSYTENGVKWSLRPGMVWLSRGAGQRHLEGPEEMTVSYVRFRGSWACQQALRLRSLWGAPVFESKVFADIQRQLNAVPPLWRPDLLALMGRYECTLASVLTMLEEEADGRLLQRQRLDALTISNYLHSQQHQPTDLNRFAAELGVSRATFCRRCRELLGDSPQRLHEALRLDDAARSLRQSSQPIRHIAQEAGFEDQRYFASRFRSRFGCCPSAYRQRR